MKKKFIMISLLLTLFSILTFSSLAYFTSQESVRNIITTGSIELQIVELGEDGLTFPLEGVNRIMPGSKVIKNVSIKNSGKNAMWLRVKPVKNFVNNEELDTEVTILDFNMTDWIEKDGWYYYNKILNPTLLTEELFNSVEFKEVEMGNEYQNSVFTIDIIAQAVQSENNPDGPLAALGWED